MKKFDFNQFDNVIFYINYGATSVFTVNAVFDYYYEFKCYAFALRNMNYNVEYREDFENRILVVNFIPYSFK